MKQRLGRSKNVPRGLRLTIVIAITLTFLLLTLTACASQAGPSTASGAQMAAANQRYESGEFVAAAEGYQALVDAGVRDGQLYYNLGNAYFKSGDLGRAILNYRRAQRLLPRDGDVDANLKLARAQTRDRIETEDEAALVALARRIIHWLTLEEAAAIALLLWIALCGLVIGALLWRKRRQLGRYGAGVVAGLLLLTLLSIGVRRWDTGREPPAVVVAPEVTVRSGPGEDYLTEFALHAGAEVRLIEQRGEWVRLVLPGGLQGWAPAAAVPEV